MRVEGTPREIRDLFINKGLILEEFIADRKSRIRPETPSSGMTFWDYLHLNRHWLLLCLMIAAAVLWGGAHFLAEPGTRVLNLYIKRKSVRPHIASEHMPQGPSLPVRNVSKNPVILLGSGTVLNFLERTHLVDPTSERLLVLRGASDTGARVLGEAYHHGIEEPIAPLLTLAAGRLEISDFKTSRPRFFELTIGTTVIRAYMGLPSGVSIPTTSMWDLSGGPTRVGDNPWQVEMKRRRLDLDALLDWITFQGHGKICTSVKPPDPGYFVALPGSGSGTLKTIEKNNSKSVKRRDDQCWAPSEFFDLNLAQMREYDRKPWIAIGGEVAGIDWVRKLEVTVHDFDLWRDEQPVTMGLYAYGRLPAERDGNGNWPLHPAVCELFRKWSKQLEETWKSSSPERECIRTQMSKLFRFDESACSVIGQEGVDFSKDIVRAGSCDFE